MRKWAIILLPILVGLGLWLIFNSGWLANPIVYLRADVGLLLLIVGVLVPIGIAVGLRVQDRAQRQAQQWAAEDRRRFLRRLDHELKNPLTAIRAGLANVAGAATPTAQRDALRSVDAQALRISRLTADLRKLAELETRALELTQVDVAELLQQVVNLAHERPEAAERHLTLTLPRAPWPLPTISADRDLLLLAVHNLVDNAIKFSQPNDTLEVRAFEDSARVVIEVADTGPGIPGDETPHVWEELYRGDAARGVPGSGLGLALVRAIIDRHHGQLDLRSRVDQGTVVTIRLPVG